MRLPRYLGAALSAMLSGCGVPGRFPDPVVIPPPTAQAISLLGDTLWSVRMSVPEAQVRLAALQRARRHVRDKPRDLNARLGLARRTASMGRLRLAIGLTTETLNRHGDDPRVYRLRGELLLATRRVDYAIRDFQMAARLTMTDSTSTEFLEIEGFGLVGVGVRFSSLLALGQAYFVRGRFASAAATLEEALGVASNADEAAAAAVWLVFADQRAGRLRQAAAVAGAWKPDARVVLRVPEHHLLLAWQGTVSGDSLVASTSMHESAEALYTFATGTTLLASNRRADAHAHFELVRTLGLWTDIHYLAAEAELARLARRRSRGR